MNKSLIFLLVLLSLAFAKQTYKVMNEQSSEGELYFQQKLDHYAPLDNRTWAQRYFVMDHWFNKTAQPLVILYICGEGECNGVQYNSSFTSKIAEIHNGIVLSLEHRFYGKSQPFGFGNDSYALPNLKYLTAQQALNDLAWFIQYVKDNQLFGITPNMPWITIGGSYPGALSAWFRYKFPHLTIGALASSAVVNAYADFYEFDQQISDSLSKNSGNCRQIVHDINVNVTNILKKGTPQQKQQLKAYFNSTLITDGDFMFYFSDITVMGVQYGSRVAMCDLLMSNQTFAGVLQNLATYALQVGVTPDQYGAYYLRNTTYSHERNARQWYYQVCSEFGWLFTPAKHYPMRSEILTMSYWTEWCNSAYDGAFPNTEVTNNYFGGLDIQATNLIFTNGGEDPWQWASKRTPTLPGMQSYIADCDQCAHCVDLRTPSPNDSPILKEIRNKTLSSFATWKNEFYAKQSQKKPSFVEQKIVVQ
ncbi:serine carboxypeptidase S28 family protein (macronuclear) [Tetrahymena thermophila SB210]|uniref:Serine carboxypeptidase S28 family protein n=1 Tax=Tetrahymena thermophila (strain SB210) TaxID=312017 RepID=I7LZW6_TETTS|nr:serine carboxypeptidase S28 family protein [Tetrahymena thermophila SB210]EAR85045.3 serine carboxypeptidase S28 family protein [Tetrahymena thermophila SB210]|eukprot:XP_001032708.3 serine carboxypeptidase S28 family protein [Tetrahymena thermophila SB210]